MGHSPACRDVETASDSATLEQALEQLKKSKRKLLPVVNSQGHLVGTTYLLHTLSASGNCQEGRERCMQAEEQHNFSPHARGWHLDARSWLMFTGGFPVVLNLAAGRP